MIQDSLIMSQNHCNATEFPGWKHYERGRSQDGGWEIYMQVKKKQLELDMEQQTGSK